MKFFSTGLLLLIVFGSLEGSTIPHKRTVRALNATIQTHFNGTIQRTNPCTNKEVERSSYRGCHEFHHHSKESSWSDYSRKCATLISDFFQAISNLVTFKDRQSGTFDLNINTKVSHKTDGVCADTKKPHCPTPTVIVESTDCEVLPSTSCDDLPGKDTHIKGSEICSLEKAVEVDEQEEEKCSAGSESSVNEEPQTAGSSSIPEPKIQPTQKINPPEIESQLEEIQPETMPTYDNYPASDQSSETTNVESSVSDTYDDKSAPIAVKPFSKVPSPQAPSLVITSAPKEDLYIDINETPQQPTGTDSAGQDTPSDSKDYLSDYKSQTDEEKTEIQPSSSATQPENSNDDVVPEDDDQAIEFSDKIALYNVREPQQESSQTFSTPSRQHYYSDTTTPSMFEIKSDYDAPDIPANAQPTFPPQYESNSYDEQIQSSQAVTFAPVQPEPENYVNQYDQAASDLPTSSPPNDDGSIEFSDQLAVYNVRQPQPESPSSSSLLNEPTSIQPESQSENYVNYEDGLVSNQLPTSVSPQRGDQPSVEFSDQLAVYNVRQPYFEPTSIQPISSESQPNNYDNYEDETETAPSSPSENVEPSVEFSDQLAVYNIRTPTTTYPPSSVSYVETSSTQPSVSSESQPANYVNYEDETVEKQSPTFPPSEEPSLEFSDQLAVYNVREPLPGTTTPYPLFESSIQPSASQSDNYVNYENEFVSNQIPTTPSPQHGEEQYIEYSDQLAVYNVREPLPGATTPYPSVETSIQPSQSDSYVNYDDERVSNLTPTTPSPQLGEEQYLEYSDQLAVYNVREPLPGNTTPYPTVESSIQPSVSQSDNYMNYDDETVSKQVPTTSSPQPEDNQYLEYSDQLAVYNVREPLPGSTTLSPLLESSIQPSSQPNYVNYDNEFVPNQVPTTSSPKHEEEQYVEYSDQLAVYNVREPLPGTTTLSPLLENSIQPSSQSDNYMNYDDEKVSNQVPSTSSPQPEDNQYLEYSDQLAVYNVREPLPGTTTPYPSTESSIQPSSQSENYMNYDNELVSNQIPTTSSPKREEEQYVEYSDQLAVYNVREPLPSTTASLPAVNEDIPSSFGTTLPPLFSSYELDTYNSQKTEVEPQSTFAPSFEEETYNFQPVTSQLQPSNEPTTEYEGEYNEQTVSNQMSSFTTPAGKIFPTMIPSSDYIDNNGPESPSDYSSSQDIGGFVSTSLPSSSDDTSSFNNFELQYDSQPTYTQLPSEAHQDEVFSDQVSDIREPQSDSSLSDERISDVVTVISPTAESENSVSYDDSSSITDSQQIIPSESQPETPITKEYPTSSSSNQPSPNNYEIYDEQSSTSENEAPVTFGNEPITSPIDVITTSPPSAEPENFGSYDDSRISVEPQGTYPPKIENESFANYEDNDTSTAGQVSVSIEPLPESDSSEKEVTSSEEGSSSEEEDGNVTVSDDQGLLPLSPNTFRPTVQIETTVNYADQTPFRPIRPPSSIGPLPENNIIYDEGILGNETEPSALGGEEADNSLIVSSEITKGNEGKEFDSSTTLAPELEFDTNYEETFKQPSSSDSPKINNYMIYEDDMQPSSPKFDLNTTTSNDYSTSFFPSTPSFSQETITTPSTSQAMPETYNDYEYPKTDFNTQTTFPPQTESVIYDDHSSQDQSLPPQQQSVDYAAYDNQIQSTSSPNPTDQEMIEISDQLSIYNVPETVLQSSPTLSELFSSSMVTTTQPTIPSDGENLEIEFQPTSSPSVEPESYDEQRSTQPLPSKDLNLDTYVNYEDTVSTSQVQTTLPPNEVEPSLEYSDQLAVYNVRQPQPESPSSSSLLNEPTSPSPQLDEDIPRVTVSTLPPFSGYDEPLYTQPTSPETEPESEEDYEDEIVSSTTLSSPKEEPSIEFSDELAIYNVRQPSTVSPVSSLSYVESSSAQPSIASQSQPDNYVSYDDERVSKQIPTSPSPQPDDNQYLEYSDQLAVYNVREPLPGTTTLSPLVQSSVQPSSQSGNYVNYENEFVSNQVPTTSSPKHEEEQYVEYSDQLAVYNVREPLPGTTTPYPTVESSVQPSSSPSDSYVIYDDETVSNQVPTTSSPQPEDNQYLEYSDQLAVYNVREPIPGTTTSFPIVESSTQPSSQSDSNVNYDNEFVANQVPTTLPPQHGEEQYVEYSDQLAVYNVREPLPGTTTPYPTVESSIQPSPQSDNYMNYDNELVSNQIPTTLPPQHGEEQYLEYSDQLAVYNVREPLPGTTTSSPDVSEDIPSSFGTTLPPLFSSNRMETYDDQTVGNELQPTTAPEIYDEPTSSPATSFSPTIPQPETYVNYESGEYPTSLPPSKSVQPFVEYSDELSIYNVRQPEYYSSSPSPVSEDLVTTTAPNLPSDDFGTDDNRVMYTDSQPTLPSESESQMYDEPSSLPTSVSQSDVYTSYDDKIVSKDFPTSPYPPHEDELSLEFTSQLASSSIAPSPSSVGEVPYLEYSDQLSIYNARQPYFETTPSSPSETENGAMSVSTTAPFPSRDTFQGYDSPVTSTDYESTPSSQLIPESQVTYEDYTVQKEELPSTLSTSNLAQSQDFSIPPSNDSAEPEFDYQATSPPQSQDNYISYEDQTASNALATSSPVKEAEPSLEYSDQLAIYNVREPVFESTTPPVFTVNIPSSITTLSPSTLTDRLTSPQPSSSESPSDNYEDYEDETVSNEPSTTLSTPAQTKPSVEYSDQLAAFNVLGPVIAPISVPVVNGNIPSGGVTTPSPSSSLIAEQISPHSPPSGSELDDDEDYEEETVSTPSPVPGVQPSLELSDELSIYNVRQRPSEVTTPSPLSENIPRGAVTPLPSDKFESYDYQPVGFGSQPTFSPEVESQTYNQPTLVPNTASQSQDNYVNYENEVESSEPMTTLRPAVDVEYSDELAIYNVRSPFTPSSSPSPLLNENPEVYTVSTFIPAPVYDEPISAPSTPPEEQSNNYANYEDQLPLNKFPITYSPSKEEAPMISSDQLSTNTTYPQPLPSDEYDYDSHVEYTDSQTTVPTEITPQISNKPTTIGPLTSSGSQPEQYVNYEDEIISTPLPTSTSSPNQLEPSVEYSDQLAVYNVREPLFEPTSPPVVYVNIPGSVVTSRPPSSSLRVEPVSDQLSSSESQSDSDDDYEDESNESSTTLSTPVQFEPSVEYSDQLAVYNVREPLPGTTTLSPLVESSIQPSSQSDNYVNYDNEFVSNQIPTTSSQQPEDNQYLEYSDQLAVYNVREPLPGTTTLSPLLESSIQPSSQPNNYVNYDNEFVPNQVPTTSSPKHEEEQYVEYSDQLAVYNVREPLLGTTTPYPLFESSIQPSSQSDSNVNYDEEKLSTEIPTTSSPQHGEEQYLEYSDQLAVYNVREPLPGTTTLSPLVESSIQPSSQSDNYVNYDNEFVSNQTPTTSSPQPEDNQYLEYSDQLAVYNVREPLPGTTTPNPTVESSVQPSSSPSDNYMNYDDETVSNQVPTTSSPQPEDSQYLEYSDQLAVYNVCEPLPGTTTSSPIVESSTQPSSQSDDYMNCDEGNLSTQIPTTPSPQHGEEQYVEYSDQLAAYNVRQPENSSSSPSPLNKIYSNEMVTTTAPSLSSDGYGAYDSQILYTNPQPTSSPQGDSQTYDEPTSVPVSSESQPDNYVNYEDKTVLDQVSSSLSPPAQFEPSIEYSDQLAVYNVREPIFEPTLSPVVNVNVPGSVVTTLSPSSSLIVEQTSPHSSSEPESESDEDYEEETVSTPSPVTGAQPSLELSDELSIYNVRQRPSEFSTPSPFNNNVISNLMTTISPYFSFKESSSTDSINTISETTAPPEYESDMYDEESSIQPSKVNEDDSQALSDETTSKDSLPETLSNFAEQTISNVIQSTQSPDLSNQLYSKNEVESQKASFITVRPNVGSSVISDSTFESSAGQEFDYQPTLSPDYETPEETVTTPSSSSQPQDNYVVYEDQTVSNELTTSSPVNKVEPSLEYSNQLTVDDALLSGTSSSYATSSPPLLHDNNTPLLSSEVITETYTDYEGSTANSPPTLYDEPRNPSRVQTPTSPQPQIVNYDYYNDQNQKPEESSTSPSSTEIDTEITLTEIGPTLPPNFESQIFDKADSIQQPSSETQPDNYVDYEESVPTSPSPPTDTQPSIEFSDELAVYNVRKPYFEPTSIQPSSSEPQSDNYDTYDDQVIENAPSTPSTPSKVEYTATQPTFAPEGETQVYDEQTSSPSTSSEPQPEQYVNYEDEIISTPLPTSTSSPNQLEPSVEYSDQLAVYNVREPFFEPTSPPVVVENVPGSIVTSPPPSSSLIVGPISVQPSSSESQSDSDDEYEDESNESSTTLSTPVQVEPSIEYSDQLAVYNVREPLPGTTTLSPLVESSIQPSSQSDNYVNYDNEFVSNQTPTTSSPQPEDNEYLEYSDQLAVYNVREPLPGTTTPYPTVESSIQSSSSPSDNYMNYDDEKVSTQIPTTSSPKHEEEQYVEYSDQLAVYNVREPLPGTTTSSPLFESSTEPSSSPSNNYMNYDDETVSNQIPTSPSPSPQPEDNQYLEYSDQLAVYNVREPLPGTTTPYPTVESSVQPSSSPSDNYINYDDEKVSTQIPTTSSPQPEDNQYLEYSDQLAVYNVREPLFEPTSPPVVYVNIPGSVVTTLPPSSSLIVEPISVQPSSESQSDSDDDYEDESNDSSTTLSTPVQLEPSIEYSDQLAVYNVREPVFEPTSPPAVNQIIASSMVTTLSPPSLSVQPIPVQPPSSDLQSDSYSYDDYKDETVSTEPSTTPSTPVQVEPSIEYSDQLAVYNIREPLFETTSPPVVIQNIPGSIVTTLSPSSSLIVEQTSPHSSPSGSELDDDEDYEEETVSTPSPVTGAQPSLELSDELSIYNVRQRPSEFSTPSPFNNNIINNLMTTISPYFTSSSNDNEGSTFQSSVTSEPEPEIYDQPYSASSPSSESAFNDYVNSEDEMTSDEYSATSRPPIEAQQSLPSASTFEYPEQLSVYNVRQRPSDLSTSSPFIENFLVTTAVPSSSSNVPDSYDVLNDKNDEPQFPPEVEPKSYDESNPIQNSSPASQPENYVSYDDEIVSNDSPTTPSSPKEEPSIEFSDELAIYNVRQPSTASPIPSVSYVESSSAQPSVASQSQTDNYVSYDDETVSTEIPTSLSPQPEDNQYLEYSDQLAVYNVREPLPGTTTLPPLVESSVQPSSQSDNYVNYENEFVSNQVPTTPSPQHGEEQYVEYSDQLAVYNVREPLPGTTTSSPVVESSIQPSSSPSDNYMNYDDETVSNQVPTTSSPQPEDSQYLEYSDQLAVYNVREPLPGTTTPYPSIQSAIQPSPTDSYVNYDEGKVSAQIPTTPSPQHGEEQYVEYSDQLAVYNVREPLPGTTTSSPLVEISTEPSSSPSDTDENYEDDVVSQQSSTSPSYPADNEDVSSSVVTTALPFFESDKLPTYNNEPVQTESQSTFTTQTYDETKTTQPSLDSQPGSYDDYEGQFLTTIPPSQDIKIGFSNNIVTTAAPSLPSERYDTYDSNLEYTDSQTTVSTDLTPQMAFEPTTNGPLTSSGTQPEQYVNYEDEIISTPLPTSTSSPNQVEPSIEYSDQLAVYNVREPLFEPTSPPVVYVNIPGSVVTTLPPSSSSRVEPISVQPSSESQSDSDDDYEDESNDSSTTLSTPVQLEPSIEYSDQLAVYNVREPLFEPTSPPVMSENIASSVVTTLSPSSSNLQSDSYSYDDYKDETVSKEPSTTLSTPVQVEPSIEYSDQLAVYNVREPLFEPTSSPVAIQNIPSSIVTTLSPSSESQSDSDDDYEDVSNESPTTPSTPVQFEPSVEYSDQLAIYNVRQPEYLSSPPPQAENLANDLVTTVKPSLGPGGFETYDNQVIYTDFQPTYLPQSDSQMYDEPTSMPASSSEPQTDNYVNYEDKMASNVVVTSASPPVDIDIEYSDELAIYDVRQTSTASPLLNNIATSPLPSVPELDSSLNAFTTLSPFIQNSVKLEQDDFYTYDDRTQSSDSQATFSPETEIEYDEAPTSPTPQSPSSTQPLLETIVTTFQPRTESQINKTSTPSKQQEVSTFPPLYPFIPLNQPSYSLPGESKLVSEQQDQVILNQVVNSPLVPSSELDSDKQFNNFSNLVKSQEPRPIDGVENTQRDTPQPEPLALVPDQTNPSNEPGEEYVSCTCTRGNKRATQHALMCPFNPVLKGNMTAPSYYILISKLSGDSGNQSVPDEERFQVEKVYLGDGTPLNCTEENKPFPSSKYTPVPISSARTVKLPIRLNNA